MFGRVPSSPNSGGYGDWSPRLLTQLGRAVVQVRFTNRPQQNDSDRQGMPARNCKGRSVLQESRSVRRQMSLSATLILTPNALIRSSKVPLAGIIRAHRRRSPEGSSVQSPVDVADGRTKQHVHLSQRPPLWAPCRVSPIRGRYGWSFRSCIVPRLLRHGAVRLSGSTGALPGRCTLCQRQRRICRGLELDGREDEISVADVLEAVGHAFTFRKSEMPRIAGLVFDVEMRSVGLMAASPARAVNGPKIVEHMGVHL